MKDHSPIRATSYPDWLLEIVKPGDRLDEPALLRAAIRVTLASMVKTGGGPFGSIVATGDGRVISVGYNLVIPWNDSTAHGEIIAIRRAGGALKTHRLGGDGIPPLKLVTTCAPCIMCVGAIHWSGIPEVLAAARTADAEAMGFIEGPRSFDGPRLLAELGIRYRPDFLREEALELFRRYEGRIYNA